MNEANKFKPFSSRYANRKKKQLPIEPELPEFLRSSYRHVLTATEVWEVDEETGEIVSRQPRDDAEKVLHFQRIASEYQNELSPAAYDVLNYLIIRANDLNHATIYFISTPQTLGRSWEEIDDGVDELIKHKLVDITPYLNTLMLNPEIFHYPA